MPIKQRPNPPMYPGGMEIGAEEEAAVLEVLRNKRLFRYYGPNPGPSKAEELSTSSRPTWARNGRWQSLPARPR